MFDNLSDKLERGLKYKRTWAITEINVIKEVRRKLLEADVNENG